MKRPWEEEEEEEGVVAEEDAPPPLKRLRVAERFKRSIHELANILDEARESKRQQVIPTRLDEVEHAFKQNKIDDGHAVMHAMREKLASLDTEYFYRSKDQRLIQHRIMAGLARFVYGPDLKSHEIEVKKYNKFETLRQEIFLTAPRRGGKTQAIAQMCAAILLCVPQSEIAAFAPSSRAAGGDSGLMGHVKKIMTKNFGVTKFERHNEETLEYKVSDSDTRKFHAYPGGGTRYRRAIQRQMELTIRYLLHSYTQVRL